MLEQGVSKIYQQVEQVHIFFIIGRALPALKPALEILFLLLKEKILPTFIRRRQFQSIRSTELMF